MASNIEQFTLRGTQYVPVEAIILSDSIGQHIESKVIKTDCEAFPGCTIKNLTRKLRDNEVMIKDFKCITLIIGTCDISNSQVWKTCLNTGTLPPHIPKSIDEIILNYRSLLNVIQHLNPQATIVICSIIPRPFDHVENRQYLKNLNNQLNLLSQSFPKCKYLNISKKFLKSGEIIDSYFIKDKIHLSPAGNRLLTDMLNTIVGQIIKT